MKRTAGTAAFALGLGLLVQSAEAETWSGFYLGLHGGAGFASTEVTSGLFGGGIDGLGAQGARGGIRAGFDTQWGPAVLGAFVDYTMGDTTFEESPGLMKFALKDSWTVGVRLGHTMGSALPYLLAGWTHRASNLSALGLSIASPGFEGLTVGGGVELRVPGWQHVTVAAEYTYTSFSNEDVAGMVGLEPQDHNVMLRLNWRLGDERLILPAGERQR
jgi:opacity protein-like surface antigen